MYSRFIRIVVLLTVLQLSNFQQASAQLSTRLIHNWEFLRQDLGGPWEAVRPVVKNDPGSVPIWQPVDLPHCVNAEDAVDPAGNYYQGPSWYRTRLNIANPYKKGRTLLHFEGAGQQTDVYIYTTKVGSHTGGYDEWTVDITDAIAAFTKDSVYKQQFKGLIPLSIRTDNSRDLERIPSAMSDFSIYGGLYRYLNLVYTPALSIDQLYADAIPDPSGKQGKILIRSLLYYPGATISPSDSISIKLIDPDGRLIHQTSFPVSRLNSLPASQPVGPQTTLPENIRPAGLPADTLSLPDIPVKSPRLWSPAHPELYTLLVSITSPDGLCTKTTRLGFRNFTFVDKGPFLLNGQRLLLRGTHRHEDHAGLGAAMTEDGMRAEMILIKEMGVNFIRLAHYQQSPIILNLCDSLGFLVWEEIPWCRGGLGGNRYKEQARQMLSNMIGQHYNHPSVFIWGLGNENDWPGDFPEFDKQKIRVFMSELNTLAHHLDPSRKTAIRRCDFCKDIPDVYSPTIWAGWYKGVYTDYRAYSEEESKKVQHFLHVEWGGDSHIGRHSEQPNKTEWSETYMCDLVDWHLKEQETMPWLTGTAQWCFKDFSTPLRPDNPIPYVNQKGVVGRDLTKKDAYYVFQSYWTDKPMAHIYGHSWPTRWGAEGEGKMVKVYSNCDEVTLFLNGNNCGTKKRNSQDFPAAGLRWTVPFQKGPNTLTVTARNGKTLVTDSISFSYQTEKWGKPAKVQLQQEKDGNGVTTVSVQLTDANNVPCLDAADWITFGLAGEGKLIDNQGTVAGSRYIQASDGRALIRVRTNGGKSVISVKAGNLPAVFLELQEPDHGFPHLSVGQPAPFKKEMTATLRQQVLKEAAWALQQRPVTVTASSSPRSAGGRHDFFSEGDYWWPNPLSPDSPYIQRDGMSNPDNFTAHRQAMIRFSRIVGALASAYKLTGDEKYLRQALDHCKAWFVDTSTLMNPSLLFAQAIKGRFTGRGIGIIDTIQLMEVVQGLLAMEDAGEMDKPLMEKIRLWFARYLQWLTTHQYGKDEMNAANNHGTCWTMQVAAFAKFIGNDTLMEFCRQRYKTDLLPSQMASDGSFPLELKRTKPYGYSIFNLDAMTTICQILSTPENNLWNYTTPDGRSIKKGLEFLAPYLADKSRWPHAQDIMYWKEWPVAQPSLVFGANAFDRKEWFDTWKRLDHAPQNEEVIRNLPVRHPLIWIN